jgi:hypothetical protein
VAPEQVHGRGRGRDKKKKRVTIDQSCHVTLSWHHWWEIPRRAHHRVPPFVFPQPSNSLLSLARQRWVMLPIVQISFQRVRTTLFQERVCSTPSAKPFSSLVRTMQLGDHVQPSKHDFHYSNLNFSIEQRRIARHPPSRSLLCLHHDSSGPG